jgi:hypothetical protein
VNILENTPLQCPSEEKYGIWNEKKTHLKDKKAGRESITGKPKLKG